jgi:hypothetical protein
MRSRGASLIELMVYCALSLLALGLMADLFYTGETVSTTVSSAYSLDEDVESAIRWLRQDLKGTALSTIVVYPRPAANTDDDSQPGMCLASPYQYGSGKYSFSEFGTPAWNKFVLYTVQPKSEKLGALVRWESRYETPQLAPLVPANLVPDKITDTSHQRNLVDQVVLPNAIIEGMDPLDPLYGGFQVGFVRSDNTVSEYNPQEVSNGLGTPTGDNTRMVEVQLSCLMDSSKIDKPTFVQLKFRVAPDF